MDETRKAWLLRARIVLVTVGCGVALCFSAIAILIGPELVRWLWALFGLGSAFERVWTLVCWPLALLILSMALASLYYFLPNVRQRWRLFTPGAALAVLGWLALSLGFRLYVSHFSSYAKTYGALGTVILLLVWLYWSGVVIIVGGEVNGISERMRRRARGR